MNKNNLMRLTAHKTAFEQSLDSLDNHRSRHQGNGQEENDPAKKKHTPCLEPSKQERWKNCPGG
jgi:hypothetical protein